MLFYRHVTTINFGPVATLERRSFAVRFVLGSIPQEDSIPLMFEAFTRTNFTGHLLLLVFSVRVSLRMEFTPCVHGVSSDRLYMSFAVHAVLGSIPNKDEFPHDSSRTMCIHTELIS